MIKDLGHGKFQLWTEDGRRPLSKVKTKAECQAQEKAIKARQAAAAKGK
jgi:hypothetical protein